jgi:multiple sugar transport system permease protein
MTSLDRQAQPSVRTVAPTAARGRGSLARKDALWGYLFVAPQVLGFLVFVAGPLVSVFLFSLQRRNILSGDVRFIGLENYTQLAGSDALFKQVLMNSLIFAAGLVPLNVCLALLLAVLLSRQIRGSTFFRTLFFSPVVTSAVAWAIVWKFMLQGENGTVNQVLSFAGINGPNWLREPGWAMFAVIFTRVLKNVGLNMIVLLAALKDLPQEYVDAAHVDGASGWQVFRKITLPLLAPTIFMVVLITLVASLQVFDHIMLMTEGGPSNATMVLVYYIYYQAFRTFEAGYASALAVVLFVIALGLTLFQWLGRKKVVYSEQ